MGHPPQAAAAAISEVAALPSQAGQASAKELQAAQAAHQRLFGARTEAPQVRYT